MQEFTQFGIKIKIGFGDPLLVSMGEEPDRIRVRLLKNFFTSQTDQSDGRLLQSLTVEEYSEEEFYHIYIYDAPKQVRGQDELENIEQASDIAKNFMFSQFLLAVAASLALNGTMT